MTDWLNSMPTTTGTTPRLSWKKPKVVLKKSKEIFQLLKKILLQLNTIFLWPITETNTMMPLPNWRKHKKESILSEAREMLPKQLSIHW